jgi:hypothetical protein
LAEKAQFAEKPVATLLLVLSLAVAALGMMPRPQTEPLRFPLMRTEPTWLILLNELATASCLARLFAQKPQSAQV